MSFYPGVAPLDKSLFAGIRAHLDMPIFEQMHEYPGPATGYEPEFYGWSVTGGPTIAHNANRGTLQITWPNGTSGDSGRLRAHDPVRYQPGCMPVIQKTVWTSVAFTTLKIKRRSSCSGVATDYTLATITGFDSSKTNRYEIHYAYLGVQGAEFIINGNSVHRENFSGVLTEPYMKSATLPVSLEMVNTAANTRELRIGIKDDDDGLFFVWELTSAASIVVDFKCTSARLVGAGKYPYFPGAASIISGAIGATLTPILSLRLGSTINTVNSRAQLLPRVMDFFAETQPGALELVWNPTTLTGATWAATSTTPGVEIDTAATVVGGGQTIRRVVLSANLSAAYSLEYLFTLEGRKLRRKAFTGTSDVLTFAAQRESAVNFTPHISVGFDLLR